MPSNGDNDQVVRDFLATWTPAINYPVVMANNATFWAYGGVNSIPTTVVIDRQNRIRRRFVGSQSQSTFEYSVVPLLYANTPLVLEQTGNHATLRWPVTSLGFTLETTVSLSNPVWTNWSDAPTVTDGSNTVQVSLSGPARFFRLRMPY
jgi:hypothetical protein